MEVPEVVEQLISSIRVQTEVITTVSTGGIGLLLLTFARVLRIQTDVDLSNFRRPSVLVIPLLLLTASVGMGYIITGSITGYLADIFKKQDGNTGAVISDAAQHFNTEYFGQLLGMGQAQLGLALLAIIVVVGWFGINTLIRK